MAKSDSKTTTICDTGPIIHLDELDSLDLISDFYPLVIPKTVQIEIEKHRTEALQHPEIVFKIIKLLFSILLSSLLCQYLAQSRF